MNPIDLAQRRELMARRIYTDPFAASLAIANFWWNAWTMFMPRAEVRVITFPRKFKEPTP